MADQLYRRMKSLACRYWGVPPWEFERAVRSDEIGLTDILDLIQQLSLDITVGPWLFNFLSPETVERVKTEKKQATQNAQFGRLLLFLKPKNEKEARFLDRLKKEVNTNGT